MKGFYIEVSNDLLDPRHCRQMGEAVWLFMWFLDKMTTVTLEKGKVLGGKPIKFKDIQSDLGISRSTYMRWLKVLKDGGYVQNLRTPYGNCIIVLKAKKRFGREVSDVSKMTQERSVINDTPMSQERHTHVSDVTHQMSTFDTCNIDRAGDKAIDKAVDTCSASASPDDLLVDPLKFLTIPRTTEEEKMVNEAIELFRPIFPGDFVGKGKNNPYSNTTTRDAIWELLKRLTLTGILVLLKKYDENSTDKYRPSASGVNAFCTYRLEAIESYVKKSAGGLWAQRSISTPEQAEVRRKQYAGKIEASRERMKRIEEEYNRKKDAK
jgi:hypothetical protein